MFVERTTKLTHIALARAFGLRVGIETEDAKGQVGLAHEIQGYVADATADGGNLDTGQSWIIINQWTTSIAEDSCKSVS